MRFFPLVAFLAFALPLAHAEPSAGEFYVSTSSGPGEPKDSIRHQYAYGESDAKPESDEKLVAQIIESLPEGTEPYAIDVFAEDTPRELTKGRKLAERIQKSAKKLERRYGLKAARIQAEVIPLPSPLARAEENAIKELGKTKLTLAQAWKNARVRPSPNDIQTGVVVSTYRGITAASAWFSTPGVSPLVATGMVAFQTSLSTFHATFARSISNTFRLNLNDPGTPIRKSTFFIRRQIYGILIGELVRYIAGAPPGADPINTWAGQIQIISFSLMMSGLDATFMSARDGAFINDPVRFARLYLANYFLLTPWQALDGAGTFPVLFDLVVYKVRASTFGMLATYFGMYQVVTKHPAKVAAVLDAIFDPIEKVVGRVQRAVRIPCKMLLDAAEDFGDHFRDFIR